MGFLDGVQAGNAKVEQDRRQRQRELTNHVNGYDVQANGSYQANQYGKAVEDSKQQQVDNKLMQLQESHKMLESIANESTMTRMVLDLTDGKVNDALIGLNKNPQLKQKLQSMGLHSMSHVDWSKDKHLWEDNPNVSISDSDLQDPKVKDALDKAFIKTLDKNGKWNLVPTESIVQSTGTMGYLRDEEKSKLRDNFNRMGEVLNGRILTTEEERLQKAKEKLGVTQVENDTRIAELQRGDMEDYLSNHPEATLADYQNYLANSNKSNTPTTPTTKDLIEQEKLKQARLKTEKDSASAEDSTTSDDLSYSNEKRADFKSKFDSSSYSDDDIKYAEKLTKKYPKVYPALSASAKAKADRIVTLAKMSNKLTDKMTNTANNIDWNTNAVESVKNTVLQVLGTDTLKDKDKAMRAINSIGLRAEVKSLMADYINLVSGAGVTDVERKDILGTFGISNWNDKESVINGIRGFSNIMLQRARTKAKGVTNPLDMIKYSRELKGLKENKLTPTTSSNSIKDSRPPLSSFMGGN